VRKMDLENWEKQILTESMNLKKSSIFILSKEDMKQRICWGCGEKQVTKFRDTSTGGFLCQSCMPDVYWAGVVLNKTEGIRDPNPGECHET
jgi:formylmethanofuran dehydrogenase subunit E